MALFKNLSISKPTTKIIEINDFSKGLDCTKDDSTLAPNRAVQCYNFSFKDGALKECNGFKTLMLPRTSDPDSPEYAVGFVDQDIYSIHYFKQYLEPQGRIDKMFAYCADNYFYTCRIITYNPNFLLYNKKFTEEPTTMTYKLGGRDYIMFTNSTDGLIVWDTINVTKVIKDAPIITSMCVCNDRLLACLDGDKTVVRYSTNKDVTTWTLVLKDTDGEIEFNDAKGSVNKLVNYLNYAFAIRDYAIERISMTTEIPTVYHVYSSSSKIYANTVAVCGDKMLMLCPDGIYEFDGNNAKKIDLKINSMIHPRANETAIGEYHNGKYYLACRLNYNDNQKIGSENNTGWKNNSLICLDVATKEFEIIRGVDVRHLKTIKFRYFDKLLATFRTGETKVIGELTESGKDFSTIQHKCWVSPLSYLNSPNKVKVIREFTIDTKYDITFTLFNESESKVFTISGKDRPSKIRTVFKGRKIGFKIESDTQYADISGLTLKVDYVSDKVYGLE